MIAIASLSFGQAVPMQGDVIQGGDAYTVRKADSNALGKMRTSRYFVKDTGWTNTARWTDNKGFKLFDNVHDSATIWINPRYCVDTNYYIPVKIFNGQEKGWLFRRINWNLTDVDSFIAIPRQN